MRRRSGSTGAARSTTPQYQESSPTARRGVLVPFPGGQILRAAEGVERDRLVGGALARAPRAPPLGGGRRGLLGLGLRRSPSSAGSAAASPSADGASSRRHRPRRPRLSATCASCPSIAARSSGSSSPGPSATASASSGAGAGTSSSGTRTPGGRPSSSASAAAPRRRARPRPPAGASSRRGMSRPQISRPWYSVPGRSSSVQPAAPVPRRRRRPGDLAAADVHGGHGGHLAALERAGVGRADAHRRDGAVGAHEVDLHGGQAVLVREEAQRRPVAQGLGGVGRPRHERSRRSRRATRSRRARWLRCAARAARPAAGSSAAARPACRRPSRSAAAAPDPRCRRAPPWAARARSGAGPAAPGGRGGSRARCRWSRRGAACGGRASAERRRVRTRNRTTSATHAASAHCHHGRPSSPSSAAPAAPPCVPVPPSAFGAALGAGRRRRLAGLHQRAGEGLRERHGVGAGARLVGGGDRGGDLVGRVLRRGRAELLDDHDDRDLRGAELLDDGLRRLLRGRRAAQRDVEDRRSASRGSRAAGASVRSTATSGFGETAGCTNTRCRRRVEVTAFTLSGAAAAVAGRGQQHQREGGDDGEAPATHRRDATRGPVGWVSRGASTQKT